MTERIRQDFGEPALDIVVHSLANAPEVKSPLVDTSRQGYLAAVSVSAYSNISLVRHLAPLMRSGGSFLSLTYMAGERVIPGYGGGMSSAKAALEADTRTLAFEAGRRWGVRVNAISAGPWASRAATAIGFIDTMIKLHRQQLAPAPPHRRRRCGGHRRIPVQPARPRHHRQRGLRGQRLPCHGHGRGGWRQVAASAPAATASISWASTASSNGFSISGRGVREMKLLQAGEARSPVVMIRPSKRSGRCSASQSCSSTPEQFGILRSDTTI